MYDAITDRSRKLEILKILCGSRWTIGSFSWCMFCFQGLLCLRMLLSNALPSPVMLLELLPRSQIALSKFPLLCSSRNHEKDVSIQMKIYCKKNVGLHRGYCRCHFTQNNFILILFKSLAAHNIDFLGINAEHW